MFSNKYGNVLTFILIIIIVLIVGILGYMGYDIYVKEQTEKQAQSAVEEFEKATQKIKKKPSTNTVSNEVVNETENTNTSVNPSDILNQLQGNTTSEEEPPAEETEPQEIPKQYYEGYEMLGTINIPKTGAKYPILSQVTRHSIEVAVGVLYPQPAPALNTPGNITIAGHNYRNGKFFSNNKKLAIGDTIEITDTTGTTVVYEIYNIYETTPNEADYMVRDTGGAREISLSTCTDDTSGRLIIWAKEK